MIIQRVAIVDYRSITKADLKLGEITVVIGPTDSGKTNIVRALRDWANNAPGQDLTTLGSRKTVVIVVMHERYRVCFVKDKHGKGSRTKFVTHDAETDEAITYEKVGLTVPKEVRAITGFEPLVVDDLTVPIHFAQQAEGWFLLAPAAWTPGKVSKVIGRISGIDTILLANSDLVNGRIAQEREESRCRATVLEESERADTLRWTLDAREIIDEAKETWEGVQEATTKIERARSQGRRLRDSREALRAANEFLDAARQAVELADSLDLESKTRSLQDAQRHQAKLGKLRTRHTACVDAQGDLSEELERCAEELREIAGDEALECPLCGKPAHVDCRRELAHQALEAKHS